MYHRMKREDYHETRVRKDLSEYGQSSLEGTNRVLA
jgi:hypothetical protein